MNTLETTIRKAIDFNKHLLYSKSEYRFYTSVDMYFICIDRQHNDTNHIQYSVFDISNINRIKKVAVGMGDYFFSRTSDKTTYSFNRIVANNCFCGEDRCDRKIDSPFHKHIIPLTEAIKKEYYIKRVISNTTPK